jgi:glycosyltransferase involved in cell wall biosynthesis
MKIAVVHNLPEGGQKRLLFHQLKFLSKSHHIDLFTLSENSDKNIKLDKFVKKINKINYNHHPKFPFSVTDIYLKLENAYKDIAELINTQNYDISLVNPCIYTQSPYVLRHLKIPSLYYCPEPKREFYEKMPRMTNWLSYKITLPIRYFIKKIDVDNARSATVILTNSKYSQKIIQSIYKVNAIVNYPGVDDGFFVPFHQKPQNYVLSVGDLFAHKGYDFVLEAISKIPKSFRPDYYIVAMSGNEEKYLKAMAKFVGVKLKIFHKISDRELKKLYQKAKLFVYGARNEPFGMVILEALSCGLGVVSVNEGGVKEILTGNSIRYRLTKRNSDEFSKAISELLVENRQINKVKQHKYIKNHFNWKKSVKQLEKILMKL